MDNLLDGIQNLDLASRSVEDPKLIRKNEAFLKDLLELVPEFKTWENQTFDKPFHLVLGDFPHVTLRRYGSSTTSAKKPYYKLKHVYRVENPFILAQFYLKKVQLEQRNGTVTKCKYFHGTKGHNLEPICLNNFNWRNFSRGVSFSPKFIYSNSSTRRFNISIGPMLKNCLLAINENEQLLNAMFFSQVLTGKCQRLCPLNKVPCKGYDTTSNTRYSVFVKYEDFEYYPQYLILMTAKNIPKVTVKKLRKIPKETVKKFNHHIKDGFYYYSRKRFLYNKPFKYNYQNEYGFYYNRDSDDYDYYNEYGFNYGRGIDDYDIPYYDSDSDDYDIPYYNEYDFCDDPDFEVASISTKNQRKQLKTKLLRVLNWVKSYY
ncbi:unnamed protein product [Brassicogethes aeneus]|uniref:PARP catalytic domain-containing protein n=1 Tax=Brassicogethes aeneus TaxID=1431903 RepID=A0A9P0FC57_BRAAE|nr:unnamed protein product [Brassicogethes aeneus]